MNPLLSWGLLAGLGLGIGLWLVVSRLPRMHGPRLAERVAPFLVDVSDEARDIVSRSTVDPLPLLGLGVSPLLTALRAGTAALFGGGTELAKRLRQAGDGGGVERFRSLQLGWAATALGAAAMLVVVSPVLRAASPIIQFALPLVAAVCAFLAKDQLLQRRARLRVRRIADELPTVLEFLALSLAAGEGVFDALRRVSRIGKGELSRELALVIAETGSGVPVTVALRRLAADIQLPHLARAIEALSAALERGSPLAEVLRAQAHDARDASKRALIEAAGKKELAMLVPLVFLILPVTVLFAIYPGIFVLQAGFGN